MSKSKAQKVYLEIARNGRFFIKEMVEIREATGIKDMNALASAMAEAGGIDRQYIVDAVKTYREYCEDRGIRGGAKVETA